MARWRSTLRFDSAREKLARRNPTLEKRITAALAKLGEDPVRPGLNLERLSGHDRIWSIKLTRGWRILLVKTEDEEGELFELDSFGPHDIYDRI